MTAPVVILKLPPPSTNRLWRRGKGRGLYLDPKYRKWRETVGWELKAQRPGKLTGPYQMDVALPQGMRTDIDNALKARGDILVAHGIVADDRFCQRIVVAKAVTVGPVIITLR